MGAPVRLFGRQAERDLVEALVGRVREGHGGVGFIAGEAGIGKTTLVDAVLGGSPLRVLRGSADELSTGRPFGALAAALDGVDRALVAELLTGTPTYADGLHFRLIDECVSALEREALRAPLLLVLEDLHWADPSTLQAVYDVGRRLAHVPLVVLVTFRPFPSPAPLDRIVGDLVARGAVCLRLGPLDAGAVAALLDHLVGAAPSPGFLARLAGAGGNPLYIRELVRALAADDAVRLIDGRAEIEDRAVVPPSFQVSVTRQLGALSEPARRTLRVAAVLGESFPLADLATVLGRPASAVLADIDEAVRSEVLSVDSEGLAFRHALVREAVYLALPATVRHALHLQAGRALGAHGAPAIEVATHLVRGASPGDDDAAEWLRRAAGETAPRMLGAAVELFEGALAIASAGYPHRFALMAELVDALIWSGRHAEAVDLTHALLALDGDTARRHRVQRVVVRAMMIAGRIEDAIREMAAAEKSFDGDAAERLQLDADAAMVAVLTGDTATALRLADEVFQRADAREDDEVRQCASATICLAATYTGEFARAVEAGHVAVRLGGASASPAQRYCAHIFLGTALMEADQPDDADRVFRAGRRIAETAGTMWQTVCYLTETGVLKFDTGQWDDAVAELEAGSALAQESGASPWILQEGLLAVIALRRGHLSQASEHVDRAQRAYADGQRFGAEFAHWAAALHQEALGNPGTALAILSQTWEHFATLGFLPHSARIALDLTRLALGAGRRDQALEVAATMETLAERADTPARRALAEVCRGLAEDDPERAAAALETYEPSPRRAERLSCSLVVGRALAAVPGHRDRAVVTLTAAHTLGTELGAGADVTAAAAGLRGLGVRLGSRGRRATARTGWESLSPTELRVATLARDGLTNNEIGARLHISGRTVETHFAHLFAKLGMTSRVQVAAEVTRRFPRDVR